jgi:hypothetical protein
VAWHIEVSDECKAWGSDHDEQGRIARVVGLLEEHGPRSRGPSRFSTASIRAAPVLHRAILESLVQWNVSISLILSEGALFQ